MTILIVIKEKRYRFRGAVKIKRNREISNVFKNGKTIKEKSITAYAHHNGKKHLRCAIIVPSKIGSSVYRNKIKRHVREELRLLSEPPRGFDILIKFNSGIEKITRKSIEECFVQLCEKLKGE